MALQENAHTNYKRMPQLKDKQTWPLIKRITNPPKRTNFAVMLTPLRKQYSLFDRADECYKY